MVTARILDALTEVSLACETIRRADKCKACPFNGKCINEVEFEDFVARATIGSLEKFIRLGEAIIDAEEEAGKSEAQRKWEAEADYWNDRRCDPTW